MKYIIRVKVRGAIPSSPFGEVWIEMLSLTCGGGMTLRHLPSGRCGLKYRQRQRPHRDRRSSPFGEVWIEIELAMVKFATVESSPFGEVWIEISRPRSPKPAPPSSPFGEVWIEITPARSGGCVNVSSPFGEVWIEIGRICVSAPWRTCHLPSGRCGLKYVKRGNDLRGRVISLRGGVD